MKNIKTKIFHVITLFPEVIEPYFRASILGRAEKKKILKLNLINLRRFGEGRHKKVDDRPFGGGAGMILMSAPLLRAFGSIKKKKDSKRTKVIVFSAKGKEFNQKMAYDLANKYDDIIIVSGRYEGIDERVKKVLKAEEVSIGHYVLTDGDVAAMVVASAVGRLLPGAINFKSLEEESHWNLLLKKEKDAPRGDGLEYPHYTRPEVLVYKKKKYVVPKVLLSGDHAAIRKWRSERH